eukprot:scaffold25830_cov101-Isochrysis_galbana.AAC.7
MRTSPDGVVLPGASTRPATIPVWISGQLILAYGVAGDLDAAVGTYAHLMAGGAAGEAPPVRKDEYRGGETPVVRGVVPRAEIEAADGPEEDAGCVVGRVPQRVLTHEASMLFELLIRACVAAGHPSRGMRELRVWIGWPDNGRDDRGDGGAEGRG